LNLICPEAKCLSVSNVYVAQVFHWDGDGGLAIGGPKCDSLDIDMKIAGLVVQRPHAVDLQIEHAIPGSGHREQWHKCCQSKESHGCHTASLASFRISNPFQISYTAG
jgi:hypothetical protein